MPNSGSAIRWTVRQGRSRLRDDDFEWDDRKAAANLAKHNISFEVARLAIAGPFCASRDDRRDSYGEDRAMLVGISQGRFLTVAYTLRDERTRIISARLSEPHEKKWYHDQNRRREAAFASPQEI